MKPISQLPSNLSYHPLGENQQHNGEPMMALNVSKTYIHMVPRHLKGVDCIVAQKGQIEYVAPDFKGAIYYLENPNTPTAFFQKVGEREMQQKKKNYMDREQVIDSIFRSSYLANQKCSLFPAEEMNLPENLTFSWKHSIQMGKLNAEKTLLEKRPKIENIFHVTMPSETTVKKAHKAQERILKEIKAREKRMQKKRLQYAIKRSKMK